MTNLRRFINILNRGFDKWEAIAIFQPERREECIFRKLAYENYMLDLKIHELNNHPDNDYVEKKLKEILLQDYQSYVDFLEIMKNTEIIEDLKIEYDETKKIIEEFLNEKL